MSKGATSMAVDTTIQRATNYPEGTQQQQYISGRQRWNTFWAILFMASTLVGIVALVALLYNVVNSSFGFVAVQNAIEPAAIVRNLGEAQLLGAANLSASEDDDVLAAGVASNPNAIGLGGELAELPKETLIQVLENAESVSAGLMRRWEHDQPFAERSQENIYKLVVERVVEPKIVQTWSLTDSLLKRSEIEAEVATLPNGELIFRSWVTGDFLVSPQSSEAQFAGVRTAIFGSLWTILITILFSLPLGVGAAIYLEEYATNNWFNRLIETNINNLAGVPSIIYGMLGLAIFVRALAALTSGALFGVGDPTTANGRTVLSAGLTLGLLILPLIIINAREAIRAVPSSLRQASYGLGATKWQTIWSHVLPNSVSGIMTGTILAISRAIGETAPLVVIGASTFIVVDPDSPFAKFTTLPIQIYQWTSRPQPEFRNLAAAAILVLLALLLTLNVTAVIIRNRFSAQRF